MQTIQDFLRLAQCPFRPNRLLVLICNFLRLLSVRLLGRCPALIAVLISETRREVLRVAAFPDTGHVITVVITSREVWSSSKIFYRSLILC
jgi:hypothetical protein